MPKAAFNMDCLDWRRKEAQETLDLLKAGETGKAITKLQAIITAIEMRTQHLGGFGERIEHTSASGTDMYDGLRRGRSASPLHLIERKPRPRGE